MSIYNQKRTQKGFTLLEVLLIVAIIAILAGITIIAISPKKQSGSLESSRRSFSRIAEQSKTITVTR